MEQNKIFITGAGGFIGSHLTELSVEMGYKVKALIHYNSRNNWGWLENSQYIKDIEVISGDIRDSDLIYNSLQDCSHIFHLAALIGIPYSYISPEAYVKTNIMGSLNVLQAAKQHKISKVIIRII